MPPKNLWSDHHKEIILLPIRTIFLLVALPPKETREGSKITQTTTAITILTGLEICAAKIILQKLQILRLLWKDNICLIAKNVQLMLRAMGSMWWKFHLKAQKIDYPTKFSWEAKDPGSNLSTSNNFHHTKDMKN